MSRDPVVIFGWITFMVVLAILLCGWCTNASAQVNVNSAAISGTITDTSGAVVPGAAITVRNRATGYVWKAVSGSHGTYVVALLPVGTYTMTVEKQGFKSWTIPPVTLAAGDNLREDVRLEVGSVTQTVQVTAQTPALQTQSATLSTLVGTESTENLPLNGRNVEKLWLLVPASNAGVADGLPSGNRPDDRRPTSSVSVNATPSDANNFLLDGMDDNERFIGTIIVKPDIDALQQVKVYSNEYPASISRTAGGTIDMVTRSGTNQFHGSAYEFLRNNKLDARNFFDKNIPPFHQNQFGASIGGPIVKNKAFFFGDFEGLRIRQGLTAISTVPTPAERNGDFAGISHVFNPFTQVPNPANPDQAIRTEYPGDQLTNMNPVALKLETLYPLPNLPGLVNNFDYSPEKIANEWTVDGRVDLNISARDRIWGAYTMNKLYSLLPSALPVVNGVAPTGNSWSFPGTSPVLGQNVLLDYVHTFGPNLIFESKGSFMRLSVGTQPLNYGKAVDQEFGIPNANVDADSSGLSQMNISGFTPIGDQSYIPLHTIDNNYQYEGSLAYMKGRHYLQMGVSYERRQLSPTQSPYARGNFSFGPDLTTGPISGTASTGNAFATFLLGLGFPARAKYLVVPHLRMSEFGVYLQDQWKVSRTLTLTPGLRWDYYPPFSEIHNLISNVDLATGKIVIAGQPGVSRSADVQTNYGDISPRFGFAKMFGQRTVLRGGYGISYFPRHIGSTRALRNPPFVSLYSFLAPTLYTLPPTIDQGLPLPVPTSALDPTGGLTAVAFHLPDESAQQYNLTVQRTQLGFTWGLSYVGMLLHHLQLDYNIDSAQFPGPGSELARRYYNSEFPNVSSISYADDVGNGTFNALEFTAVRRFSHGLDLVANYTWSHAINNAPTNGGQGVSMGLWTNLQLWRGNADEDVRNRATISGVWQLPFGSRLSGWEGILGRGWQANGIFTAQSGFPFSVGEADCLANDGQGCSPILIGNPNQIAHRTVQEWFNTAAFAQSPLYSIGNVGRNILTSPAYVNIDFSTFKNFRLTERFTLQFRSEFFNLFNRADFGYPDATFGTPGFGTINNTANYTPRQIQFAMKLLF